MKKTISLFILFCWGVTVCNAQDISGRNDSSSFNCLYKISFLNQTIEYGERIGWDTIPWESVGASEFIVWDTTMVVAHYFGNFSCSSFDTSAKYEVAVKSCDGTKKMEIEKSYVIVYGATPTHDGRTNGIIDLNKWCYLLHKFPQNYSGISGIEIYLKGIAKPLVLDISITDKK